jgi:hypothetical protein
MASKAKFTSLLVCDDCRKEDNGKDIAIGIYTGSLLFVSFPAMVPYMAFRFEVIPVQKEYGNIQVVLQKEDGKEILRIQGGAVFSSINEPGSFFFKVGPVAFENEGTFKVLLGMDEDPEEVAHFKVAKFEQKAAS